MRSVALPFWKCCAQHLQTLHSRVVQTLAQRLEALRNTWKRCAKTHVFSSFLRNLPRAQRFNTSLARARAYPRNTSKRCASAGSLPSPPCQILVQSFFGVTRNPSALFLAHTRSVPGTRRGRGSRGRGSRRVIRRRGIVGDVGIYAEDVFLQEVSLQDDHPLPLDVPGMSDPVLDAEDQQFLRSQRCQGRAIDLRKQLTTDRNF